MRRQAHWQLVTSRAPYLLPAATEAGWHPPHWRLAGGLMREEEEPGAAVELPSFPVIAGGKARSAFGPPGCPAQFPACPRARCATEDGRRMKNIPGKFKVAVEDLTGVWSTVQPVIYTCATLEGVVIGSGTDAILTDAVAVEYLPISQEMATEPHGMTSWNWRPFVHLILVSSESPEDYKARARPRLRQTVNEDFPVCGRRVVAFVRPRHLEISAKGPKKVYDLIAEDCTGSGRKPLAVHCRLDPPTAYGTPFSKAPPPLAGHLLGLGLLKDALRSALGTEITWRKLQAERLVQELWAFPPRTPAEFWRAFATRDNLAHMVQAAGLLNQALLHYQHLQNLVGQYSNWQTEFGGATLGDDRAAMLREDVFVSRYQNSAKQPTEFDTRQYLMARVASLLSLLGAPDLAVQRAVAFLRTFAATLSQAQSADLPHLPEPGAEAQGAVDPRKPDDARDRLPTVPPLLCEAWTFTAALEVVRLTLPFPWVPRSAVARGQQLRRRERARMQLPPSPARAAHALAFAARREWHLACALAAVASGAPSRRAGRPYADEWGLGLDFQGLERPWDASDGDASLPDDDSLPPDVLVRRAISRARCFAAARDELLRVAAAVGHLGPDDLACLAPVRADALALTVGDFAVPPWVGNGEVAVEPLPSLDNPLESSNAGDNASGADAVLNPPGTPGLAQQLQRRAQHARSSSMSLVPVPSTDGPLAPPMPEAAGGSPDRARWLKFSRSQIGMDFGVGPPPGTSVAKDRVEEAGTMPLPAPTPAKPVTPAVPPPPPGPPQTVPHHRSRLSLANTLNLFGSAAGLSVFSATTPPPPAAALEEGAREQGRYQATARRIWQALTEGMDLDIGRRPGATPRDSAREARTPMPSAEAVPATSSAPANVAMPAPEAAPAAEQGSGRDASGDAAPAPQVRVAVPDQVPANPARVRRARLKELAAAPAAVRERLRTFWEQRASDCRLRSAVGDRAQCMALLAALSAAAGAHLCVAGEGRAARDMAFDCAVFLCKGGRPADAVEVLEASTAAADGAAGDGPGHHACGGSRIAAWGTPPLRSLALAWRCRQRARLPLHTADALRLLAAGDASLRPLVSQDELLAFLRESGVLQAPAPRAARGASLQRQPSARRTMGALGEEPGDTPALVLWPSVAAVSHPSPSSVPLRFSPAATPPGAAFWALRGAVGGPVAGDRVGCTVALLSALPIPVSLDDACLALDRLPVANHPAWRDAGIPDQVLLPVASRRPVRLEPGAAAEVAFAGVVADPGCYAASHVLARLGSARVAVPVFQRADAGAEGTWPPPGRPATAAALAEALAPAPSEDPDGGAAGDARDVAVVPPPPARWAEVSVRPRGPALHAALLPLSPAGVVAGLRQPLAFVVDLASQSVGARSAHDLDVALPDTVPFAGTIADPDPAPATPRARPPGTLARGRLVLSGHAGQDLVVLAEDASTPGPLRVLGPGEVRSLGRNRVAVAHPGAFAALVILAAARVEVDDADARPTVAAAPAVPPRPTPPAELLRTPSLRSPRLVPSVTHREPQGTIASSRIPVPPLSPRALRAVTSGCEGARSPRAQHRASRPACLAHLHVSGEGDSPWRHAALVPVPLAAPFAVTSLSAQAIAPDLVALSAEITCGMQGVVGQIDVLSESLRLEGGPAGAAAVLADDAADLLAAGPLCVAPGETVTLSWLLRTAPWAADSALPCRIELAFRPAAPPPWLVVAAAALGDTDRHRRLAERVCAAMASLLWPALAARAPGRPNPSPDQDADSPRQGSPGSLAPDASASPAVASRQAWAEHAPAGDAPAAGPVRSASDAADADVDGERPWAPGAGPSPEELRRAAARGGSGGRRPPLHLELLDVSLSSAREDTPSLALPAHSPPSHSTTPASSVSPSAASQSHAEPSSVLEISAVADEAVWIAEGAGSPRDASGILDAILRREGHPEGAPGASDPGTAGREAHAAGARAGAGTEADAGAPRPGTAPAAEVPALPSAPPREHAARETSRWEFAFDLRVPRGPGEPLPLISVRRSVLERGPAGSNAIFLFTVQLLEEVDGPDTISLAYVVKADPAHWAHGAASGTVQLPNLSGALSMVESAWVSVTDLPDVPPPLFEVAGARVVSS